VRRILVEVDEDSLSPLLLPPGRGDEIRPPALELARDRYRGAADLVGIPAGLQPDIDVQAAVPGRLRVTGHARLVQQRLELSCRLLDVPEVDARRGVQVDPQLVSVLWIAGQVRPDVK